jgi:hypothetical protein
MRADDEVLARGGALRLALEVRGRMSHIFASMDERRIDRRGCVMMMCGYGFVWGERRWRCDARVGIRDRARVGVDVVGVVEVGACVVMSWIGRSATEGVGTTTVIDRHDGWWIFVEDIYG